MARFDCATWKPVGNHGGPMAANRGLILHHAVADGSLFDFFNNPASEVSAHFWVALNGRIEQYVDTATVAWHAVQLNDSYIGVETEGCVDPPHADPMPDAMVDALARLYAEGARRHGWANALAEADGQAGFGYHRMAVATACPCDVRLAERSTILSRAFGDGSSSAPPPAPSSPPPPASSPPPAPGAPPWPGVYLANYIEGHGTATWQARMAERGWAIDVDDCYGNDSEAVCRAFQAEKGLAVDGIVGPATWNAAWTAEVT